MIPYIWFAFIALLIGLIVFLIRYRIFKGMRVRILIYFILAYVIGMIWDYIATTRGHWVFSKEALLGIYIGIIPLEDIILMGALVLIAMTIVAEKRSNRKGRHKAKNKIKTTIFI